MPVAAIDAQGRALVARVSDGSAGWAVHARPLTAAGAVASRIDAVSEPVGVDPLAPPAYTACGVYAVTVTARDAAGNSTSATRKVRVSRPARRCWIRSTVATGWKVLGARTTVTRLRARRVPKGARAQVRCSGRRCPFGRRTAKRRADGTADLRKALGRDRVLRAGQTLEVRVTRRGMVGKVLRYRIRRAHRPLRRALCIPAGATSTRRRC